MYKEYKIKVFLFQGLVLSSAIASGLTSWVELT